MEAPYEPAVVCERADFLLVDKPPHVLSHPTRPDGKPTLLGWLQERFPGELIALINRLDRETSGLILVARTADAASILGKLTMNRGVHKEYLALIWGAPEADHGIIDAPLGRLGISPTNPIWLKQGVIREATPEVKAFPARSEYWVERRAAAYSEVRLAAHTGRMHQLRVHMAYLGFPVVGDKIYGPDAGLYLRFIESGWTAEHAEKLLMNRHALHASRMRFDWKGETIEVTSEMPEDMRTFRKTWS